MSTPTEENNGTTQGVTTPAFTIAIVGIVIIGLILAGYVILSGRIDTQQDEFNAQNTWRMTELRGQRNEAKANCEKNFETLQTLQEWVRQQPNSKPPPASMTLKQCPNFTSVEKENKEH